jgi:hypothetical protein
MADFSHTPNQGDKFPIEVPPGSGFERFLATVGGFFKGIRRGIKHIFSDDYCKVISFSVSDPEKQNIPAAGGFAAAVAKSFTVKAQFSGDGASCKCCEYRQFVRGTYYINGVRNFRVPNTMTGPVDPIKYREDAYPDAAGRLIPRGYRSQAGTDVDRYSPDQSGGCTYQSEDAPQIPAVNEQASLEFLGMIVDVCEGRVIDIKAWSIELP